LKLILRPIILLVLALVLAGSGCIRREPVPEKLPVNGDPAPIEKLVERINSYKDLTTLAAQVEIYVRDTSDNTTAKVFPGANGAIRVRRPQNILVHVTAPILNSNIADLTSDGEQFRLAIYYPKDSRMFIHGSNLKELHKMTAEKIKVTKDPRLRDAGTLANIRPQHITDAFIIKPISEDPNAVYFREEVMQTEDDVRPGKKGRQVERTYYVLYVLERGEGGRLYLRRKFWFDRTQEGTPLARQQTFENGDGKIGSDVTYSGVFHVRNSNLQMAKSVRVKRPNDGYEIWMVLDPDTVEVNLELPSTVFVLENKENLKDLDLDRPRADSINSDNRPQARTSTR
jgi:hypothetical protein